MTYSELTAGLTPTEKRRLDSALSIITELLLANASTEETVDERAPPAQNEHTSLPMEFDPAQAVQLTLFEA